MEFLFLKNKFKIFQKVDGCIFFLKIYNKIIIELHLGLFFENNDLPLISD